MAGKQALRVLCVPNQERCYDFLCASCCIHAHVYTWNTPKNWTDRRLRTSRKIENTDNSKSFAISFEWIQGGSMSEWAASAAEWMLLMYPIYKVQMMMVMFLLFFCSFPMADTYLISI